MSIGALLLRVLLCLGLLANGTAQAIAVTHSAMAGHRSELTMPPCHETSDVKMAMSHAVEDPSAPSGSAWKKPDCCKSGACDCACSHGAVATLSFYANGGHRIGQSVEVSPPPTRYASPALPLLIRPPIV